MPKPEVCVCAAVLSEHKKVVVGRRHNDCLVKLKDQGWKLMKGSGSTTQGFVTSLGRYVDRKEAFRLQKAAGVPSAAPDGYREGLGELFSEDLY